MSAPGVITDTMANIRTVKDASGKEYTYKVVEMTKDRKFLRQLNIVNDITNSLKDIYNDKVEVIRSGSAINFESVKANLEGKKSLIKTQVVKWIEEHCTVDYGHKLEIREDSLGDVAHFLSGVGDAGRQYFKSKKTKFLKIYSEEVPAGGYSPEVDEQSANELLDLFDADYTLNSDTGGDEEGEKDEVDYSPEYTWTLELAFY